MIRTDKILKKNQVIKIAPQAIPQNLTPVKTKKLPINT